LLGKNIPRTNANSRGVVAALLDELNTDPEQYRFGVTKVFFKTEQLAKIEEMREKRIGELLITIQAASRAYMSRQLYKRMTAKTVAIKIIQRNIRTWVGFKNWTWWKLFAKARPMLKRRNFEKEIEDKTKAISDLNTKLEAETKNKAVMEKTLKDMEVNLADLQLKLKREKDASTFGYLETTIQDKKTIKKK